MNVQEARTFCREELKTIYSQAEAEEITDWLLEFITGSKKNDRILRSGIALPDEKQSQLSGFLKRLKKHEPLQYVLNESWFSGLKFYVDKNVLIPRPETEELVEWIITNCKFPLDELSILDIGTGSGAIPISLKRRLRKATVWSCDISREAIEVAKQNAILLRAEIHFRELDVLDPQQRDTLPKFDIIVSNPPYVPLKDKETMKENVLLYEPETALFVPDNDPLVFYQAIAEFGKTHLNRAGSIYTEIHENLGKQVINVFQSAGYNTELKKDMHEKDRMIRSGLV